MSNLFFMPKNIISGRNALENAGPQLAELGRKALIVSGPNAKKMGNVSKVEEVLKLAGVEFCSFAEVDQEPTCEIVEAGVKIYRDNHCDFLVAIGGGSPIDAMKAIAMIVANGGTPADYMGVEVKGPVAPMAAIPTTAGTGSEVTQFTIISDTKANVKMLLKGACLLPELAIVDPVFTMSVPPSVTAATGIDALCHSIEAYTSRKAQPLSDTFALSAIKKIFENLRTAYQQPQDEAARTAMAIAATEAGIAFNNASVTLIHGMSRPIGALFHVPHGISNAMLMEKCLRFAVKGGESRFADIARHCGMAISPDNSLAADILMNEIRALLTDIDIPTLEQYGIEKDEFDGVISKMASDAQKSGSPGNTLRDVTIEDMERIYRSLWN